MSWDGVERRSTDARVAVLEEKLAEHARQWDAFLDPENGRFAKVESAVADIVELRTQAKGGIRLLLALGSAVVAGAATWAWIADYAHGLIRTIGGSK